ncbi:MAG: PD-(D/E)XK nuclease family transposase [Oscillospiraceae bacterium]|nr:PD-(D/E)XK nuclease family transposase [Oscillospiraceae bacterium]
MMDDSFRTDLIDNDAPEILPPYEDGVFKSLLTRPEANPVLRSVASAVLRMPVKEVTVLPGELAIETYNEKQTLFDVSCLVDDDRQIVLEMQASAMEHDSIGNNYINLKSRCGYYLAKRHCVQVGRGVEYPGMLDTYLATFTGFTIFPGYNEIVYDFAFHNTTVGDLGIGLGIVFIDLTNSKLLLGKEPGDLSLLEKWSAFFAGANKRTYWGLLEKICNETEEVRMASDLLQSISRDQIERDKYIRRCVAERDRLYSIAIQARKVSTAFAEGEAKGEARGRAEGEAAGEARGRAEGEAAGEARGKAEAARQFAISAIMSGLKTEDITRITGMTEAQVDELRSRIV